MRLALVLVLCVLGLGVVGLLAYSRRATTPEPSFAYTAFDIPDAKATTPNGRVGERVFGGYLDASGALRGFLYNLSAQTLTTLEEPEGLMFPIPTGLSGDTLVGSATDGTASHGFFYDVPSRRFTIYDHPSAAERSSPNDFPGTHITGIADATFFGHYRDATGRAHGFMGDRATQQTSPIDHPAAGSGGTFVTGLDGQRVIGYARDGERSRGFLLDRTSGQFTAIEGPSSAVASDVEPAAISGDTIVGTYTAGSIRHGFVYDIKTRYATSVTHPLSEPPPSAPPSSGVVWVIVGETHFTGVFGTSFVGHYTTPKGEAHGFFATRR